MTGDLSLDQRATAPNAWSTAGAWVFRHRSWLPVPFMLVLVLVRQGETRSTALLVFGAALVALGEIVRMWSVRQIGAISRTRAARHGPLVTTGPFAIIRNPLYVGNWLLWTGFVLWSRLLWMLPVGWILFALQHKAIVRWEEDHLLNRFATTYTDYVAAVPRWLPRFPLRLVQGTLHPWSHVMFSERGTLTTIATMGLLLTLKHLLE